jgi:hypothetical protein
LVFYPILPIPSHPILSYPIPSHPILFLLEAQRLTNNMS